jgi:hypothetical protein
MLRRSALVARSFAVPGVEPRRPSLERARRGLSTRGARWGARGAQGPLELRASRTSCDLGELDISCAVGMVPVGSAGNKLVPSWESRQRLSISRREGRLADSVASETRRKPYARALTLGAHEARPRASPRPGASRSAAGAFGFATPRSRRARELQGVDPAEPTAHAHRVLRGTHRAQGSSSAVRAELTRKSMVAWAMPGRRRRRVDWHG